MGDLAPSHRRRLREVWRSAGWPCHDPVELDLLVAGLLQRCWDDQGRETLRVTDLGIAQMATSRARNRQARSEHDELVETVARQMQRAGRIVWLGLALRVPLADEDGHTRWVGAMPDVFSIRNTSVEGYVEPVVHEIKVSRSDLLADLRRPSKGQAYRALSSQCWYVVRGPLCDPEELPAGYGLIISEGHCLEVVRPALRREIRLGFATWMALAKASPVPPDDDLQPHLVDPETTRPASGGPAVRN